MSTANPMPERLAATDPTTTTAENDAEVDREPSGMDETGESSDHAADCGIADDGTVEVELTNKSSQLSSYRVGVAFAAPDSERNQTMSVQGDYIRPGERTVWNVDWSDWIASAPVRCEVLTVDQMAEVVDPDELEDVVSCEIVGDTHTDVVGKAQVRNGSWEASDYFIWFAFNDAEGVRRGGGIGWVEVVDPGESAPVEVHGSDQVQADGFTCEAVSVARTRATVHSTPWDL
jgi:hypothetical protein